MAGNQIQFVINPRDYIGDKEPISGFGSPTDFFSGEDLAFSAHKSLLSQGVEALRDASMQNPYSRITYAKVKMRSNAIAKTHRPTKSIFTESKRSFVVGGIGIGELLIEMHPEAIEKVYATIAKAEDVSREKTSRIRSEVGGIQSISSYSPADRVPFTVAELMGWKEGGMISNGYYVGLFHPLYLLNSRQQISEDFRNLLLSFKDTLESFDNVTYKELSTSGSGGLLFVHIESSQEDVFEKVSANLMDFFSTHPLVRKVTPAPSISSYSTSAGYGQSIDLPNPGDISRYPIVGVIDNGISDVFDSWVVHKANDLPERYRIEDHGSKIAGLLVCGNALNGSGLVPESDGCRLADLFLLPSDSNIETIYPEGLEQFFDTLKSSVEIAKEESGARIFNLSMNQTKPISGSNWYSIAAQKLDEISDELDVQFVISAGNLSPVDRREIWDAYDPTQNIANILPNHIALPPAESIRGISVIALNPGNMSPSSYTRVGPMYKAGIKPDLSYIGGEDGCELSTINMSGEKVKTSGTSMSTPLVAKILASLDNKIDGNTSLEVLKALLIHNTSFPAIIEDNAYDEVRTYLYGFGIPSSSDAILTEESHSFTVVIADNISSDKKLSMSFPWPDSLKNPDGTCRGDIKLTLVSRPSVDSSYGEELVRENITAYLRACDKDGKKRGLLSFAFSETGEDEALEEEILIKDSFKWNPIKISYANLKRKKIVGDVFLEIEYLSREGVPSNFDGVPFAAILTISDPMKEAPVNVEMKAQMQAVGIQLSNIQVAARVSGQI